MKAFKGPSKMSSKKKMGFHERQTLTIKVAPMQYRLDYPKFSSSLDNRFLSIYDSKHDSKMTCNHESKLATDMAVMEY